MLIIQILQAIAPLLEEYCSDDPAEVVQRAKQLSWWQRRRWRMTIRGEIVRTFGSQAWREVGRNAFPQAVINATAENKDDIVARVMAC